MKQVIRLTESQLKNIIKNVISEQGLGSYGMSQQSAFNSNNRPKPSAPSTSQPNPNGPESTGGPSLGNGGARNNTPAQDIIYVQKALLHMNFGQGYFTPDGKFGSKTKAVVIAFQKQKGLPATGIVDQATAQALGILPLIKTLPVKQNVFPKPVVKPNPVAPAKPVDFKFDQSNADNSIQNRQTGKPSPAPSQDTISPDYRKRQGN